MKEPTLISIMGTWTPEQLLAVHDFCQMVGDAIWTQHEDELIDLLHDDAGISTDDDPVAPYERNLSLPLDEKQLF